MPPPLDLTLVSLYRLNGQEWPLLPGLLAQNPPRKLARGREQDRLLVYLTLAGNVLYSSADYSEMVAGLSETFYQTPGSITYALKTTVESLNTQLANNNMKTTGHGQYTIGALVLGALRGNQFYLVQAGPTHIFWLGSEATKHFHDTAISGKGLGLSQTARMYFAQANVLDNDRLLLCASLPNDWQKSLAQQNSPSSLEATRRRLMTATDNNLNAILMQVKVGKGEIHILRPGKEDSPAEVETTTGAPQPVPRAVSVAQRPTRTAPQTPTPPAEEAPPPAFQSLPVPATAAPRAEHALPPLEDEIRPVESAARPQSRPAYSGREKQPLVSPEQLARLKGAAGATARFMRWVRVNYQKAADTIERLIPRLLPGEHTDTVPGFSASWLAFFAVAIPLLVMTMAAIVYGNFGRTAQYDAYYTHAVNTALQTLDIQDPIELRVRWQTALTWLDKAEAFEITDDSRRLRQEAQQSLDNLDRIKRLEFRQALVTPLSNSVNITRMAASDTDLYLLDGNDSKVYRALLTGGQYTLQGGFVCEPGQYDGVQIARLVDILTLPRGNDSGASLIGVDINGNLIYCSVDRAPRAASLQRPDLGWDGVTDIAYDAGNLYVLDANNNAVWVYFAEDGFTFPNPPLFFFEEQIPAMENAISLAVNGDDLYLLHTDGHLTTCTLSRIFTAPTRCTDPAILTDTRPGYTGGPTLADGLFKQIEFTSPPDPSVALLEPFTQSVFRFSPRALELQNQLRAMPGTQSPFPKGQPITAMTFSPNKVLFVYVGGQVYFAVNIP